MSKGWSVTGQRPARVPVAHGALLALLLLSVTPAVVAQLQSGLNKDSLRQRLLHLPDDTAKANLLITLGQQYENNQPDSAVYFYLLSGRLSEQLNNQDGIVRYINNYTAVLNVQGRFEESLRLNLKAVDICRRYKMKMPLVKALINTGAVYQYMEKYAAATGYYLEALPLLEADGNVVYLSLVYGNLCGLYRNLNQPQKALPYARKALLYAQKAGNRAAEASASINLGNALKDVNELDAAIEYLQQARQTGIVLDDKNTQETALINLGDAYLKRSQPRPAQQAFEKALALARSINDVSGTAYSMQGIAQSLFQTTQYTRAAAQLYQTIQYARQHEQKEVLGEALLLMSDVQIGMDHLQESQRYRAAHDSVREQLVNTPLLKNIQELETQYGVEKKQRELLEKNLQLEQKNRETQRQRQWLVASVIVSLLLLALLLLIYRLYRQKQLLNEKALRLLRNEQEQVRLQALLEGEAQERHRISQEMHDDMGAGLTRLLFMSRSMGTSPQAVQISTTTESLIQKMNEVIWMMNHDEDRAGSLIAHIRATTAEMLEHAGIHFEFTVSGLDEAYPLDRKFRRNVYLAVKEAVHNAVKHATATHIDIHIEQTGQLDITVKDNGKGLGGIAPGNGGNGMRNMRSRMAQLQGSVNIHEAAGTTVHFSIPLPC